MWVIRDKFIKKRMNEFITDKELSDIYENNKENKDPYIIVNIYAGQVLHVKVKIIKELFQRITPYRKNEWNPYPEIEPPKVGTYLVTVQGFSRFVEQDYYEPLGFWSKRNKQVVAFRELPEPCEPMEENV